MATTDITVKKDAFRVLTVEDTIKKYTPDLSDNDIKAFVWYNRTLGIPMTGFEKWFIKNTNKNVVVAKRDVDYLNQQYEVIGKFQKNDEVGKVTRFENEYNGTTYVAVRRFDNSLCIVEKSALEINDKYEVSTGQLNELVRAKSLMYLNGMYLPLHVYSNTDYDTLHKSLLKDSDYIIENFGQDVYDYHKSILSVYVSMRVDHPIKDKRYKLNPFGEIAREVMTTSADSDREVSVKDAFIAHIRTLKNSDFELVSKDVFIERIVYNNERITRGSYDTDEDKKEAQERRDKEISDAKLECDRLFSDFLTNNLDGDTVNVINKRVNETYNRSIIVNTSKIPVGFKCTNKLKTFDFSLKPVQVEGFKFAISRNNYCLALTMGFGKTSLQISIISYLLGTGTIKKPLLIVPKPVMKNWQKELFGFWSNGKLTSFTEVKGWERNYGILSDCGFDYFNIGNLNQSIIKKTPAIKKIDKGIILGSYEALQKMYLSDSDVRMFIIERWKDLLEQASKGEESDRESSKKISTLISKLNKVDKDAEIDIMELGFDSIYFDEAHRLKNLFSGVSADKTNRIKSGFKGNPSDRSLRAFYITQYFQKIKGRIGFLTATPFSNSPLEVYTMLIFLNYSELVKNNVYKIVSFVEQFFNETQEYKVNSSNKIVTEAVMKSYKNKPILYKILSNTFLYKNDPKKADIKRPCIIRYPNKDIKLMLKQSPLQELQRDVLVGKSIDYNEWILKYPEIEPYLQDFRVKWAATNQAENKLGLAGKILSASKSSALSPFCNSPLRLDFVTNEAWKELYHFSPKIRFTIDCISNMMKEHEEKKEPSSSFLIYVGLGVNLLQPLKEALNAICGYKTGISVDLDEEDDDNKKSKISYDEVEIIEGSADSDKEADRRERVGDLFNKGKVKVIIGTDTIKEGLNLQVNCATLFILTPTWNSTDIKQVEGRIHRQGNKFGYARIITPLVTRTLDSFIYQKYEEKESRLTDIWEDDGLSTTGNLDVQIPPEKQKELILDDAKEIAKIRAEMMERKETNNYDKINDEYDGLKKAISLSSKYKFYVDYFRAKLPEVKEVTDNNLAAFKALLGAIDDKSRPFMKSRKERFKTLVEYYEELQSKVDLALQSNIIVDLINIFNGSFKRRSYNLNLNYEDIDDFKLICKNLNIENPQYLLEENIFKHIGVSNTTKASWERGDYESIYDLSSIYSQCSFAEKFILNPEGLSLVSTSDELDAVLVKYKQKVDDKLTSIASNFDVEEQYKGLKLVAKQEFKDKLEREARIELDEENKLSLQDNKLANYFTYKTNVQLSYRLSDIDLESCAIPYSDVDVAKIIATADIIPASTPEVVTATEPESDVDVVTTTPSKVKPTLNTIGDDYFNEFADKVIGEMSISDFRNMIIVKGTKNDVIKYFDKIFEENEPQISKTINFDNYETDDTNKQPTQIESSKENIGIELSKIANVAREIHKANPKIKEEFIGKKLENDAIIEYAKSNNLWVDDYISIYGNKAHAYGVESDVYLSRDGKSVYKINNGIQHGTWLDFFNRIIAHNIYFPETKYEIVGYTQKDNKLAIILKQDVVEIIEAATDAQLEKDLTESLFIYNSRNNVKDVINGVILRDLHKENVVINNKGDVLYLDPIIQFEHNSLFLKELDEYLSTIDSDVQPNKIEPTKQDIQEAIDALRILADIGDEDAKNSIDALELLLNLS